MRMNIPSLIEQYTRECELAETNENLARQHEKTAPSIAGNCRYWAKEHRKKAKALFEIIEGMSAITVK